MLLLSRLHSYHKTAKTVFPDAVSYSANQKVHVCRYAILQEFDRIKQTVFWIQSRTLSQWMFTGGSVFAVGLLVLLGLTVLFLSPHKHTYSFSEENCFFNPIILPNTVESSNTESFKAEVVANVSISSTPLFSAVTCIEIAKIPNNQTQESVSLKLPLSLEKNIQLSTHSLPTIQAYDSLKYPVSPDAVLLFSIDKVDKTFSYQLDINGISTDCVLHSTLLGCPLKDSRLDQGTKYNYRIMRTLHNYASQVITDAITTLDPLVVTKSNVQPNEIVYSMLANISIETNKPVTSISGATLQISGTETSVALKTELNESTAVFTFESDLPRNTNFTFTVDSMSSTDGSFLSEPYVLQFKTSAGPQVQGINIDSYKVAPNSAITINFDVELETSQAISEYASITTAKGTVESTVSIRNNSLTIRPNASIGICEVFSVEIKDGIKNKYGVAGSSYWNMQSRTTCQQVFSIGNSVQGRSITGYKFGNGNKKILFVGGMHGDEKSSVNTMNSFIDDLERNFSSIPTDKTVIVIPNSNPDGFAASTRVNANNVDLNRNFPTFDWTSGVYMPRNIFLEFGGGLTPLSEPESTALASYTSALSPRLVLTYHATGRAVFANDAGDSKAIADIYAEKSGFRSFNSDDSDTFFSYPTTGEYEDWIHDKLNLPALLVELATVDNNEFNRQKSALWAMLNL